VCFREYLKTSSQPSVSPILGGIVGLGGHPSPLASAYGPPEAGPSALSIGDMDFNLI
jgi:hypothetical protein